MIYTILLRNNAAQQRAYKNQQAVKKYQYNKVGTVNQASTSTETARTAQYNIERRNKILRTAQYNIERRNKILL